ncbi:MAG: tetratricopeptide repeat protein, partial [Thermoplasmata archaeon]|nr:tetratricopeptide repeat protein [Thermoplasmata archaeon]
MAICPKCKSNVNTGVQTCPKCGTNMPMGGSGGDLIGGGSLLGGGALQRKQRSGSGGALGVGPTSFGDQVSFVGGSDAAKQIENINVAEMDESHFKPITDQMNTILTQMGVPSAINKNTKLTLPKAERKLVDLIAKKLEEAEEHFGRVVGNHETYIRLGNVYYLGKRTREYAIQSGEVTLTVGLKDEMQYEQAIAFYDKAIELNNNFDDAWNNKGNVLDDMGKYEDAIACYDKAIEINPNYEVAWNNKGYALGMLKRVEEAIECYDKAIEIKPNYAEA